ncbi:hypothetical protein HYH02_008857 [Chlamydomonas schloesseri]|uniref:C-type lectin domain-containing protein n=1 Tax=Chlamydomonas schloesseri TaxID=2026947 RepID=A0A835WCR3_9CHLO|nr:hypothetical protein HYH02_008857 [Chlamydomonas schloesseri]|eukprot:KAG2444987.1 hypothetical protein HYH02_008857 [Chlamydomonas schloesseri]
MRLRFDRAVVLGEAADNCHRAVLNFTAGLRPVPQRGCPFYQLDPGSDLTQPATLEVSSSTSCGGASQGRAGASSSLVLLQLSAPGTYWGNDNIVRVPEVEPAAAGSAAAAAFPALPTATAGRVLTSAGVAMRAVMPPVNKGMQLSVFRRAPPPSADYYSVRTRGLAFQGSGGMRISYGSFWGNDNLLISLQPAAWGAGAGAAQPGPPLPPQPVFTRSGTAFIGEVAWPSPPPPPPPPAAPAPDGFVLAGTRADRAYWAYTRDLTTHVQCSTQCTQPLRRGGLAWSAGLPSVRDADEHDTLISLFNGVRTKHFSGSTSSFPVLLLLGGYDDVTEGSWYWADGTPVTYGLFTPNSFSPWDVGEPNDAEGEDNLAMYGEGAWTDIGATQRGLCMCWTPATAAEGAVPVVPQPDERLGVLAMQQPVPSQLFSPIANPADWAVTAVFGARRYFVSARGMLLGRCQAMCWSDFPSSTGGGASIVSVHSQEENDAVGQLLRRSRRQLFDATGTLSAVPWLLILGGTDSEEKGTWSWMDGTPFDFGTPPGVTPPWHNSDKTDSRTQPDKGSVGPDKDCLNMWPTATWDDIGCSGVEGMCMCYTGT